MERPVRSGGKFKLVKEKVDCRLILCGSMASDDPEGIQIYEKVKQKAKNFTNNGDIILITRNHNPSWS